MKKRKGVWVVEGRYTLPYADYHPTVGVALTQADGKRVLRDWRQRNPDDRFRLVRYVATM